MGRKPLSLLLLVFCLVLTFTTCFAENAIATLTEQTSLPADGVASPAETSAVGNAVEQVPFSPEKVSGIQSATLTYTLLRENRSVVHTAELTDAESLTALETLLREVEKLDYGTPCFAKDTDNMLTLSLANGTQSCVSVALDSCTVVRSDGVYYDFMPSQYRGKDNHPDNTILYSLFSVSLF